MLSVHACFTDSLLPLLDPASPTTAPSMRPHHTAPAHSQVRMKDDIKAYLTSVGVDWEEVDDLAQVRGRGGLVCVCVVVGAGGCRWRVGV